MKKNVRRGGRNFYKSQSLYRGGGDPKLQEKSRNIGKYEGKMKKNMRKYEGNMRHHRMESS